MATDVNKCMPMFAINLELLCWYACNRVRADDRTKTKELVLFLGAQNSMVQASSGSLPEARYATAVF